MICKLLSVVRTLLFYSFLSLWTILTSCFIVFLAPIVSKNRRHGVFVKPFGLGVVWGCRVICGVKYRVTGLDNIPKGPTVIAANHQSTWETFYLQTLFSPQAQVIKQELLSVPFFGWAFRLLCVIPIDRGSPKKALVKINQLGSVFLKEGISVLVFPEGTRKPSGKPGKFSKGAAAMALQGGKPVLPVAHNAGNCWPAKRWLKCPGTIDVVIGPVITIEDKTSKQITVEAEQWILQQLEKQRGEKVGSDACGE